MAENHPLAKLNHIKVIQGRVLVWNKLSLFYWRNEQRRRTHVVDFRLFITLHNLIRSRIKSSTWFIWFYSLNGICFVPGHILRLCRRSSWGIWNSLGDLTTYLKGREEMTKSDESSLYTCIRHVCLNSVLAGVWLDFDYLIKSSSYPVHTKLVDMTAHRTIGWLTIPHNFLINNYA